MATKTASSLSDSGIDTEFLKTLRAQVRAKIPYRENASSREVTRRVTDIAIEAFDTLLSPPDFATQKRLIGVLVDDVLNNPKTEEEIEQKPDSSVPSELAISSPSEPGGNTENEVQDKRIAHLLQTIKPTLLERIDVAVAGKLASAQLKSEVTSVVRDIASSSRLQMNQKELAIVVDILVDDMIGLGPLEPLLNDPDVSDIMVNGPYQIYIERKGKLELTSARFSDNEHVMNVAQRIVAAVGRRVDESSPICDARLADGSRVNIIAPPLAIDGCSMSIRKFSEKKITLDDYLKFKSCNNNMANLLKIAGRARLNIVISGGTGSGKTTLLNALSQMVDPGERVVTIEDAAELQLQQPHVVRLETRPANLEGTGEITMRDLVKNALRMRPDRVILGEVRGPEAIDVLQAMNTGHDGSMCTLHANTPRDAITRMENMIMMGASNLPQKAMRQQIAGSVDLIVQIGRMRDGGRRIKSITEVVGMDDEVITTQELYKFEFESVDSNGKIKGDWVSTGVRPYFLPKAEMYDLGPALLKLL